MYLPVVNICCADENIWFSSMERNGLFKLDLSCGKIEYIGAFENANFMGLHVFVFSYDNKIYFFNMYNDNVDNFRIVSINTETMEQEGYWQFRHEKDHYPDIIQNKDRFIMIPENYSNPLVVLNLKKGKYEKINNWIAKQDIKNNTFGRLKLINNNYYGVIAHSNQIVKINGETLKAELVVLGAKEFELNQLFADGDGFFVTGYQMDKLIEWRNGKIKYINLPGKNIDIGGGAISNKKLYLFPTYHLQDIIVYDITTEKIHTLDLPETLGIVDKRKEMPLFGTIKASANKVIAPPWKANAFIVVDSETDTVSCVISKIGENATEDYLVNSIDLKNVVMESEYNPLTIFLKKINATNIVAGNSQEKMQELIGSQMKDMG